MTPLNGTKTHPLSAAARAALLSLQAGPRPAQEFNPGLINRLLREAAVELVQLPSPYKKGGNAIYVRLTGSFCFKCKNQGAGAYTQCVCGRERCLDGSVLRHGDSICVNGGWIQKSDAR